MSHTNQTPGGPPRPGGPPPPSGSQSGPRMTTGPGLAACLAYVSGWLGGIIVLATEKKHAELRYHAAQSLLLDISVFVLSFVGMGIAFALLAALGLFSENASEPLAGIIVLGVGGIYMLVMIGYVVAKIVCAVKSYRLQHVRVPLIGRLAERMGRPQ